MLNSAGIFDAVGKLLLLLPDLSRTIQDHLFQPEVLLLQPSGVKFDDCIYKKYGQDQVNQEGIEFGIPGP